MPPILWSFVIFIFSIVSFDEKVPIEVGCFDKTAHFLEYGILAFLMIRSMYSRVRISYAKSFLFTLILGGGYGILLELVQRFIPAREASLYDIAANFAGVISGIVLGGLYYGRNKTF